MNDLTVRRDSNFYEAMMEIIKRAGGRGSSKSYYIGTVRYLDLVLRLMFFNDRYITVASRATSK